MPEDVMEVNVSAKVEDKIAQIEARTRRILTPREHELMHEMFISGLFFGIQWQDHKQNEKV